MYMDGNVHVRGETASRKTANGETVHLTHSLLMGDSLIKTDLSVFCILKGGGKAGLPQCVAYIISQCIVLMASLNWVMYCCR